MWKAKMNGSNIAQVCIKHLYVLLVACLDTCAHQLKGKYRTGLYSHKFTEVVAPFKIYNIYISFCSHSYAQTHKTHSIRMVHLAMQNQLINFQKRQRGFFSKLWQSLALQGSMWVNPLTVYMPAMASCSSCTRKRKQHLYMATEGTNVAKI